MCSHPEKTPTDNTEYLWRELDLSARVFTRDEHVSPALIIYPPWHTTWCVKVGSTWPGKTGTTWPVKVGSTWPVKVVSTWPVKVSSTWPGKVGSSWPVKVGTTWPVEVGGTSSVVAGVLLSLQNPDDLLFARSSLYICISPSPPAPFILLPSFYLSFLPFIP